jgi:hypothetical protein
MPAWPCICPNSAFPPSEDGAYLPDFSEIDRHLADPDIIHIPILPLPHISPLYSQVKWSFANAQMASLMFTRPTSPTPDTSSILAIQAAGLCCRFHTASAKVGPARSDRILSSSAP